MKMMWSPPTTVCSVEHSKLAKVSCKSGQPPSPVIRESPANLSGDGVAKRRDRSHCSAVRTFMAKYPDSRKLDKDEAFRLRLHKTMGGSRETAENEFAVSPSSLPSRVRVVITVTPVAKRPRA
jgi:hypothetical protein